MNTIGDTFRFYFRNLPAILRPAIFFLLPPLVTLAAMIPGLMTHFGLLISEFGRVTVGTEIPPILSQRLNDFQMFLLPLLLISQITSFYWEGAISHLAGVRMGLIPAEGDQGPAMTTIRRFLPLLLTGILVGSLMMITNFLSVFTLFLPSIFLAVMTSWVPLVLMVENLMGGSALVRSFRLNRGRFFITLLIRFVGTAVGTILTLFLAVGASITISMIFFPGGNAELPDPATFGSGSYVLPAALVDAMSITYIASLALMFIVKYLVEIPLSFSGMAALYVRAGITPEQTTPSGES